MKAKIILQSALAVIMAAFMLASCGAAEDVSADGENRLTRAEEEAEETVAETKEDTAKPAGEATGEEAGDTADETTTNAEISTDIKYFPDKTFLYNKYIIDAVTGEILLTTDEIDNYPDNNRGVSFEKNLLKYIDNLYNVRYIDANGNEVTRLLTNGYEVFRDDSGNYGVKDKNGNIVIEAMYDELKGNADNTYFYFTLNSVKGVLNDKGEIIIKGINLTNTGLDPEDIFYPENIVTAISIYSLPSGELIGEYEQIRVFDDKTFMVTGFDENDNPYAKIIDSNGNQIADLLSDSPLSIDEIYEISILQSQATDGNWYSLKYALNIEKTLLAVSLRSNDDEYFYGLFNNKGEKVEGWVSVNRNNDVWYEVSYSYGNILSILLTHDAYNKVTERSINSYNYNGELISTDLKNAYAINGKVFNNVDSDTYVNVEGAEIGEFSSYSSPTIPAPYWSNALIVTDTDGMFKGVIIGDELKYPCEYTNIDFVDGNISFEPGQLLKLQKGSETIYITAETGAVVDLPQ
jgi:hypothetical protein